MLHSMLSARQSFSFSFWMIVLCTRVQRSSIIITALLNSGYAIGTDSRYPLKYICAPSSVTRISIFVSLSIFSIIFLQKIQFVFPILSVAYMRSWLVHCPTTFTTLVLPMLGKVIMVFPFSHIRMHFSNSQ